MDETLGLYPRSLRTSLERALADTPVVCLLGPRQCGKSTLAGAFNSTRAYITLDEEGLLATARLDPSGFVASLPNPVTLDEVQRAAGLVRAIKAEVDRARKAGRYLLTGSANLLLLPQVGDSLAGRVEILQLHPLTESEKERRPGAFLDAFLSGRLKPRISHEILSDPADLPCRIVEGGYPEPLARPPERARQWHRQYLRTLIERDVRDIARVRDADEVGNLLEVLAHRTAELLNTSSLSADLGLRRETIEHCLSVLERLFLIRRLPAWHRNPARRLVKAPKIHLLDTGLAATLCGLQASDWLPKRERFGHLLESFVVQQLMAQAGWTDPDLRFWHYRDKDQVEVDLVISRGHKTWGVEVKASATASPSDGHGLRLLADRAGRDFQQGILLYAGNSTLPLSDPRLLAVPLAELWRL